jgi:hypothetical protein
MRTHGIILKASTNVESTLPTNLLSPQDPFLLGTFLGCLGCRLGCGVTALQPFGSPHHPFPQQGWFLGFI